MIAKWPLCTFMELGALPDAVPCVRLHTRQVLWEWGLSGLTDTAELIVSEFATNAVRASGDLVGHRFAGRWRPGTPPFRMWLASDGERIAIQVWDASDLVPRAQDAGPEAESGRGLLIVASICADWGSFTLEGSSGKIVWALLPG